MAVVVCLIAVGIVRVVVSAVVFAAAVFCWMFATRAIRDLKCNFQEESQEEDDRCVPPNGAAGKQFDKDGSQNASPASISFSCA